MNYVLLANIGNRHIKELDGIKANYRTASQDYLDNERPVTLNILPPFLDKYKDKENAHLVLFGTDQEGLPDGKPHSDTLFAAQVVARQVEAQYGFTTQVRFQNLNPTDYEVLLRYYRETLNELLATYPDALFAICDAGGTNQQKSSLLLTAEFVVGEGKLEVWASLHKDDDTSQLRQITQRGYRAILNALQAEQLIGIGQYAAAAKLLPTDDTHLQFILRYLDRKINGFPLEDNVKAKNDLATYKNPKRNFYFNELLAPVPFDAKALASCIEPHHVPAVEQLTLAQFYLGTEQWGDTLMAVAQFAEVLAEGIMKAFLKQESPLLWDDDLRTPNKSLEKKKIKLVRWRECTVEIIKEMNNYPDLKLGQAAYLLVSKNWAKDPLNTIMTNLFSVMYGSFYGRGNNIDLTTLRNRAAHEGKYPTRTEIDNHLPGFLDSVASWPAQLDLPKENYYQRANRLLRQYLRKRG